LLVARSEAVHQVEGLLHHPVWARLRPVHLVDDHDRLQTVVEGLARHEAGLRHGPFNGVDHQQHRIHHRQHAFHLAAEIRMSGRVHDVDPVVAPADRRVLGEDRYAALALQVVPVHGALRQIRPRRQGI
jgi:hypothetical protein